jgi:hypothetical protein
MSDRLRAARRSLWNAIAEHHEAALTGDYDGRPDLATAVDALEAAVRADEKRRIMDNDIASANMGRIE